MPYNNNPITPSNEVTGTTYLPLARVKKIIAADPDTSACSNNAAFAIAIASQLFVQHLVKHTHGVVVAERRGTRRYVHYEHVANAVSRIDNLEFLADVVPRTMTYRKYKERKAKGELGTKVEPLINGQKTLDQMGQNEVDDKEMEDPETDRGAVNGAKSSQDELGMHSPSFNRTAAQTRHNFDAVRNGYYEEPGRATTLEE